MQSQKLDIVELIETNPITKLSKNYQGKFLQKIQNTFTETEQRLFVSSLYNYLNYDSKKDFIIELESIWKWLGFGRKEECKRVLTKHFNKDIDYKITLFTNKTYEQKTAPQVGGVPRENALKGLGGEGKLKEKILMTINTFKKLCLKSNTKKADDIHEYFIKLEELTLETITEESIELKNQLQEKNQEIQQIQNERMTPTLDVDYMGNPKQEDLQKVVDRLGLDNYQMSTLFQILHDVCRNVPSKLFGGQVKEFDTKVNIEGIKVNIHLKKDYDFRQKIK